MSERRILIVLTSHEEAGEVRPTGYHVGEAAEAWRVFTQAGFAVDVAAVAGGAPRPDGYEPDDPTQRAFVQLVEAGALPAVRDVDPEAYDALYLSGGHGTLADFRDPTVTRLVSAAFRAGRVVSAVCHGVAALLDAATDQGRPVVRGRAVTSFSDEEERAIGLAGSVPFLLQQALVRAGAEYRHGPAFSEHVVTDGTLVTGQNPASAHATAHAVLDAVSVVRAAPSPRGGDPGRKVWFVTGASAGFGEAITRRALAAGDAVVATARDGAALAGRFAADPADSSEGDLLTAELDVTEPRSIRSAVMAALDRFGRIDVLVNNAGYGLRGATEEWDLDELRRQFDTNVFGLLRVTRAVLPVMRSQRSGHVLQMSSVGGVSATLGGAAYAGSKFAVEGLSEGLAAEVAGFGVRVTIVEPGPFRTDFAGRSTRWSRPLPAYRDALAEAYASFRGQDGHQPNDPDRAARILVDLSRMEDPPLRLPLGPESFARIRRTHTERLAELDAVEELGSRTAFDA